jgi:hypothetical protein
MEKIKPVDIIALVAIIGGFILMGMGKDSTVSAVILGIAAYYFGKSTTEYFYHK